MPPDLEHNMLTINQGHNNRISGDTKTKKTSAAISDLKPHKVKCLGKLSITLHAQDIIQIPRLQKILLVFSQGF